MRIELLDLRVIPSIYPKRSLPKMTATGANQNSSTTSWFLVTAHSKLLIILDSTAEIVLTKQRRGSITHLRLHQQQFILNVKQLTECINEHILVLKYISTFASIDLNESSEQAFADAFLKAAQILHQHLEKLESAIGAIKDFTRDPLTRLF